MIWEYKIRRRKSHESIKYMPLLYAWAQYCNLYVAKSHFKNVKCA